MAKKTAKAAPKKAAKTPMDSDVMPSPVGKGKAPKKAAKKSK